MVSLLLPGGVFLWNSVSDVGRSVAEVKSEVENLQASLGDTPRELQQLLDDFDRIRVDLAGHVRRMGSTQESISGLERQVETRANTLFSVLQDLGDIKRGIVDIKEALQPNRLPPKDPASKSAPR
jgi:hypothetical protein